MSNESFYVIWNPTDRNPMLRYETVELATTEARRLAELNPGLEFMVLRSLMGVTWRNDPWRVRQFCKSK